MSTTPDQEAAGAARRQKLRHALTALLVMLLALAAYTIDGRAHLNGQSGDTDAAQLLPIALLAGDGFTFDRLVRQDLPLPYAFRRVGDHVLSQYPVLPGLLNTVTYAAALAVAPSTDLARQAAYLSLLTGSALTALSVGAMFLLLRGEGLTTRSSAGVALLFAFGTSAFSVASRGIWQHGPALFFLSTALLLLRQRPHALVALAGVMLGLAVEARVPVAMLALPLLLLPWQRGRGCFAWFIAGMAVPVLLMRIYAWAYWGSPFALAENMGNATSRFFGPDPLEGFAGVLVSPGRGLFIYSPFVLFAIPGVVAAWRRRDLFRLCIAAGIVFYVVTAACWHSWWGGKSFGSRMLTETLPGLTLLAASPIVTAWSRAGVSRALVTLAIAWSLLVNYAGARHYPQLPFIDEPAERAAAWSLAGNELAACLRALQTRIAGIVLR